ncbi:MULTISPECIES: sulfatase-like hydrolase/transferase [Spongiibacter]|uniref:sulfatase-like hydrolase/transferase n=1 Tax=Spongiibacter TaxID=630749 RepID=UPI000C607C4C|nr:MULTISPECIES: sulfatase-like hydrolase/transferase [Spongiibacter]MAY40093.1 sulfatase [Spongiibacter sp.]MBU73651.1 sulfatase [Spongiibacter sp.]|tara:strand:- start:16623 stop:18263 length:1641 start_codon:yes stop_codon:yes gene_type:complete
MKKILLSMLLILLLLVAAVWPHRGEWLLRAVIGLDNLRHPVAENQPVHWRQGEAAPGDQRPNVILIVADDLGFNDISFHRGEQATLPTPAIDALARQGVSFSSAYAGNAVCAPSRAMLMTGRYSTRFGFEFTPAPRSFAKMFKILPQPPGALHSPEVDMAAVDRLPPFQSMGMPGEEITLAEQLQAAGYHTLHIGKWHLGRDQGMRPEHQGFDESLLMESGLYLPVDDPQVVNARQDFDPLDRAIWLRMRYAASYNGSQPFAPSGYLTDYYTDQAVSAIAANKDRPFFLYLAHWGVHSPLQALKADYDALSHIQDHRLRVYSAMLRALDRSVSRVMQSLVDNGIDDNTLVIFTSDNGAPGYLGLPDLNAPFRGWKLSFFEGGVRVPFYLRWPKQLSSGLQYDAPVSHLDVFATVAAAAGIALPQDRVMDSVNLLPYVNADIQGLPHDAIFWREGAYQGMRAGDWKLMRSPKPRKIWLYNLKDDPLEAQNLAAEYPQQVADMAAQLDEHNRQQQPSRWPSIVSLPVLIDKTMADPASADDEYIYWPN